MEDIDAFDEIEEIDLVDGDLQEALPTRTPTGLMILCVFTIVGNGFLLLKDQLIGSMHSLADNFNLLYGLTLNQLNSTFTGFPFIYPSCAISIVAAFLMLRLNRNGFFLYIGSNLIYAFGLFWIYRSLPNTANYQVITMILALFIILPIGFIILYGPNRKYMS